MAEVTPTESTHELKTRSHICTKRTDTNAFLTSLHVWSILLCHLIYTPIFAIALLVILNERYFAIGDRPYSANTHWKQFYQSDISTLISVGLVVSRLISSAWQSLVAWRCGYLLLEKSSLKLSQFSRIVNWKIPASLNRTSAHWFVFFTLLLTWPSQIVAPLLSGAVLWIPATDFQPWSQTSRPLAQVAEGNTNEWSWYKQFYNNRQTLITQAMTFANTGIPTHQNETGVLQLSPSSQRVMVTMNYTDAQGILIDNLTLPSISISNFQWLSNPKDTNQLPENFRMAIMGEGNLTVTGGENSLWNPVAGNAAILLEKQWAPPTTDDLPDPSVVSLKAYAAVLFSRNNDPIRCLPESPSSFSFPPGAGFIQIDFSNNHSNCYLVATFDMSAGIVRCTGNIIGEPGEVGNCTLSAGRLVTAFEDSNQTPKLPDPLVNEALALMPQTMQLLAASSISYYPWNQKDPALYLQDVLIRSYQGCWTSLTAFLASDSLGLIRTRSPFPVIQIKITSWRVILWAGLNCCMGLAGLLLWAASVSCESSVISTNDPALTALLLDSSQVLERDRHGLCNARTFTGRDDDRVGRVGLRRPAGDAGFCHYRLTVVEGSIDSTGSEIELGLLAKGQH